MLPLFTAWWYAKLSGGGASLLPAWLPREAVPRCPLRSHNKPYDRFVLFEPLVHHIQAQDSDGLIALAAPQDSPDVEIQYLKDPSCYKIVK